MTISHVNVMTEPEKNVMTEPKKRKIVQSDIQSNSTPSSSLDNSTSVSNNLRLSKHEEISNETAATTCNNDTSLTKPQDSITHETTVFEDEKNEAEISLTIEPDVECREVIAKVYHFLKKEFEITVARNPDYCDFSHLSDIRQRVADATGSSVRTVTRILSEERERALAAPRAPLPAPARVRRKKTRPQAPNIDQDMPEVERTIEDYINTKNELPDLKELHSILSEKIDYNGSMATLQKTVRDLGYELSKIGNKRMLTNWVVVKAEHVSDEDEEISEDVKPPLDWSIETCNPGALASESADATEEVPMVRIKSEPEPASDPFEAVTGVGLDILEVKQEPDFSS